MKFLKKTKEKPKNLKDILERLEKLEEVYKKNSYDLSKSLQKVGLVRFNPFKETGGDQSFSVAALDADNNGFVITSHYGRESNRVYAKPIGNGKSSYQLSKEEQSAVNKAMTSN